jgi:putative FmdB family regulatory protein
MKTMPTYDYICKSCDHEWELFQSITAKPARKCPQCGERRAQRVIGPGAGIIFRGSGFYQTDYRSESYKKKAEAERSASEKAGSNGKSEKSSDSKSATTKTTKESKSTSTGD